MTAQSTQQGHNNDRGLAKYTMSVTVMITGVAAYKIRKFEEYGLCKPARTESKQRLYSDYDIDLIKQIDELEQEGINLPGVKAILSMKQSKVKKLVSNQTKGVMFDVSSLRPRTRSVEDRKPGLW